MNHSVKVKRRNDIDWLRIFAVLLLVPFHSALIFVLDPNSIMYVKDHMNSILLERAAGVVHQFHMPLLFVLAGVSSYFALGFRSCRQYMLERFKRLMVPAIFGMVILIPPMTYITCIARGDSKPFLMHLKGYFRLNPSDLAGYYGTLTPAHLWFIIFLFVFSIVGLPLFLMIHKNQGKGLIKRTADFFQFPFTLMLLGIPVALAASLKILGDKNPIVYFLMFFYGFLIMADGSYQKAIDRDAPLVLILAVVIEFIRQTVPIDYPEWSLFWILFGLMENANRWLWVISILGLGHRFLNAEGPVLRYLSEAAFPFYILHLPINTFVGFFIVRLSIGVAQKYTIIVLLTVLLDFLLYDALRRIKLFKIFLGMKTLPPQLAEKKKIGQYNSMPGEYRK